MHRRAGEQHRNRNAVGAGLAVGQDDDVAAAAHLFLGALAQRVERPAHAVGAVLGREGDVEGVRLEVIAAHLRDRADLLQVVIGEDRLAHFQALGVRHAFEVEQIRPRPDDGDEAHHQLFADRIDRRVGHLREVLLEIGEQRLRLVRQRRDRRVVAHGADRFLAGRWPSASSGTSGLPGCSRRPAGDRAATGWRSAPHWRCRAVPPARSGCARATPCRDGSSPASPSIPRRE